MKQKTFFTSIAVATVLLVNGIILFSSTNAKAAEALPTCKSEVIDCPGWGTGDRTVCITTGTGVACNCGDATKCPSTTLE